MESSSEWNLMKAGQFELAYEMISSQIANNPNSTRRHIYNRGLCLLNLKKAEQALVDFRTLIELRPDSDAGYIGAGLALWWMDQYTQAIEAWSNGINSVYTDAAGGISVPAFLFFAATKLKDPGLEKESIKLLRIRYQTKQAGAWPGPIAGFLLAKINEADLIEKAEQRPALRTRMLTKVRFWLGVHGLRQKNIALYRHHLYQATLGHILEPEYYLAKAEIRSLDSSVREK